MDENHGSCSNDGEVIIRDGQALVCVVPEGAKSGRWQRLVANNTPPIRAIDTEMVDNENVTLEAFRPEGVTSDAPEDGPGLTPSANA
jgi:hypothetical protein